MGPLVYISFDLPKARAQSRLDTFPPTILLASMLPAFTFSVNTITKSITRTRNCFCLVVCIFVYRVSSCYTLIQDCISSSRASSVKAKIFSRSRASACCTIIPDCISSSRAFRVKETPLFQFESLSLCCTNT